MWWGGRLRAQKQVMWWWGQAKGSETSDVVVRAQKQVMWWGEAKGPETSDVVGGAG